MASLMNFESGSTHYKSSIDPFLAEFIYDFLWWIMIINLLVALFNMLPLGILDGGRFFQLTIEKFFGEKIGLEAYRWAGRIILGAFLLLLLIWVVRLF